jgi:ABC-2 type transport system permease protein
MSLARTLAIARKELAHLYRDPQILFMVVIAPALILFMLTYVFAIDADTVDIGVLDLDRSPDSRQVLQQLTAGGELRLVQTCNSYQEVAELLTRGRAAAVLVFPPAFGRSVQQGQPIPLQAIVDGSSYFGARSVANDLATRLAAIGLRTLPITDQASAPRLAVQMRTLYNFTGKWLYAMVPGLMAAALCFPAIAMALACTREMERGSYESLLSTPLRPAEYLMGKLLPYLATGMVGALLAWGLALAWFRVPFRGTLLNEMALTLVFMLALMSMSILVGVMANVQRHAILIIVIVLFIPTFFMSGLLVPLDPERPVARIIKLVLPAANYVISNRAVFLKGLGLADLWTEVHNLLRIAGMALLASYLFMRRKVA